MADGWDPERLGEPGQRPAPRLSLSISPPTFLFHLSVSFSNTARSALEHFLILCVCVTGRENEAE